MPRTFNSLLATLTLLVPATYADTTPTTISVGYGETTCATYLQYVEDKGLEAELAYLNWAEGFISALAIAAHLEFKESEDYHRYKYALIKSIAPFCVDRPEIHIRQIIASSFVSKMKDSTFLVPTTKLAE